VKETMKKLYIFAFVYLVLGLVFGVFYREFTVMNGYNGETQLSVMHTHALVLGTLFLCLVLVLHKLFNINKIKGYSIWFIVYNVGFIGLLLTLLIRGMGQVLSWELNGFNHIAGLFHTILGTALIWFFIILGKSLKEEFKLK